jgi:hypothetical protein
MSTRAVARWFYIHFSTINSLQHNFKEFGSMANRPHNRRPCEPRQPRTSTSGFFTWGIIWDQSPRQLRKLWVCTTRRTTAQTVSGTLICVLVVLTRDLTWLQLKLTCCKLNWLDMIWIDTPVYVRFHSWKYMSEQKPSHEVKEIFRRALRQDCVEAQIWGGVPKNVCSIEVF